MPNTTVFRELAEEFRTLSRMAGAMKRAVGQDPTDQGKMAGIESAYATAATLLHNNIDAEEKRSSAAEFFAPPAPPSSHALQHAAGRNDFLAADVFPGPQTYFHDADNHASSSSSNSSSN